MASVVGVARLTLYLEGSFSLKDKRHVVRSLTQQVSQKFNAALAETADLDDHRVATLVVAVVSHRAPHADAMLAKIVGFVEARVEMGVLGEVETELIPLGD